MNQLQVFENELFKVSAKTEGDQVLFDVEQIALSLGFTTIVKGSTYVRWNRVNSFLPQDLPRVAKGDLIPESLVYKLAFKAQNDIAEKFQDWLAVDVIPSIRKTGSYQTEQPKNQIEILQTAVNELSSQNDRITNLEENMRINGIQERKLQKKGSQVVMDALNGKNSSAYEKVSSKTFSEMWRDFKDHFMIPRYNELPKSQFEEALHFLNMWQPSTSLRMEIKECNNQQTLRVIQ